MPDLLVIADVCLCEYTDHGHCGVLEGEHVINDQTLPLLARAAVSLAEAGADVVAPSDMMDGRVAAIRRALDAADRSETPILSYAAKYASAFYGPFREAAESAPQLGDRRGYQMDPANAREALREIRADLEEGADMILVKPALPCLDILRAAREICDVPLLAFQVSGRVQHAAGRDRAGLARRRARDRREPDRDPARRSRCRDQLLRQGLRAPAWLRSSTRSSRPRTSPRRASSRS